MQRIREQFDADLLEANMNYSHTPTEQNHFSVYCANCAESFFADRNLYDRNLRSLEEGFEDPFICDDCQGDDDELEYPHRD